MSKGLKVEFIDNSATQYDDNAVLIDYPNRQKSHGKLYLGDQFSSSYVQLKARNIISVVCCSSELFGYCKETNVTYSKIDPDDYQKYGDNFIKFIDDKLVNGKNVLVNCENGIGKSATIILLYLMKAKNLSLKDGKSIIEKYWKSIKIKPSLANLLLKVEKSTLGYNSLIYDGKNFQKLVADLPNGVTNGKPSKNSSSGFFIISAVVIFFGVLYGALYALTGKA